MKNIAHLHVKIRTSPITVLLQTPYLHNRTLLLARIILGRYAGGEITTRSSAYDLMTSEAPGNNYSDMLIHVVNTGRPVRWLVK